MLVRERENVESRRDLAVVGFQIKSYDDCVRPDLLRELKAQRDDSFRKVQGLNHYYIVMSTDEVAHKNLIRRVEAEFRTPERTTVIEPTFAFGFLGLGARRIDALVARTMESGDLVYKKAVEALGWAGHQQQFWQCI